MLRHPFLISTILFLVLSPANLARAQYPSTPYEGLPQPTSVASEPQFSGPLLLPSQTAELPPAAAISVISPEANPAEVIPTPTAPSASVPPDPSAVTTDSWFADYGVPAWVSPSCWDGSFEVGVNGTEGNAQAFSFRTGGNIKRKIEQWEFTSDVIYAKSLANGIETQHNAIFNAGYERFFGDSPWSHFGKTSLEYDEFKAFDLRLGLNTGIGYQFLKTDVTTLKGRVGAGVSHEFDSPDDRWVPEAVFGGDYSRQISKRQKLSITADYFPEMEDFNSYRLVTNLGWELFLDDASNLSLKLSVNDRYDSTPNGRKPNDVIYSLLLLWKI